jgi:fumarylacetoacetate (FAA) hydrolase
MKLGSLKSGRDGRLVVVSHDLAWCADATHIVPTLQAALDDWSRFSPQLELLATDLQHEAIPMMRFHERTAAAPLGRAFLWATGDAGAAELRQRAADQLLGARDPVPHAGGEGISVRPEILVVTDDVERGVSPQAAAERVLLVGLASVLAPDAGDGTIGSFQAALSPVFVTPDELGQRWRDGKLHGPLNVQAGGEAAGWPDVSADLAQDFGTLIAQLAALRPVRAGSMVGSTLFNGTGAFHLKHGDALRIWTEDEHGHATFGTIEQTIG